MNNHKNDSKLRKSLADEGCFHRGHGGRRARKVARIKKAVETRTRRASRAACNQSTDGDQS